MKILKKINRIYILDIQSSSFILNEEFLLFIHIKNIQAYLYNKFILMKLCMREFIK